MESELVSLFAVVACAFVCPLLSAATPNRIIPETVFLLVAGMLVGPNVFGLVQSDIAVGLLSDLGLGFLFLLAGYEIDVQELSEKGGKHGLRTWIASFVVALAVFVPIGICRGNFHSGIATAIVLTTTAFGTLVPILKDRNQTGTIVGKGVVEYGVWGELCPIIAMAALMGTRATWLTALVLLVFAGIAVGSVFVSKALGRKGSKLYAFMRKNRETNAQTGVRFVMVLLVGLVALSAAFDLDIVLGAFAAGFALRAILPEGDSSLEHKLNGIAYGFFVPLFFVVSGMRIDPEGVVAEPALLVAFIACLLLVRAVPVFVSLSLRKDMKETDPRVKASIAFYCTTALPLVVAVTSVAVSSGAFTQEVGSTLIAAGGITVLAMPLFASIVLHTMDAELARAARKIAENPRNTLGVLKEHVKLGRERNAIKPQVLRDRRKEDESAKR